MYCPEACLVSIGHTCGSLVVRAPAASTLGVGRVLLATSSVDLSSVAVCPVASSLSPPEPHPATFDVGRGKSFNILAVPLLHRTAAAALCIVAAFRTLLRAT